MIYRDVDGQVIVGRLHSINPDENCNVRNGIVDHPVMGGCEQSVVTIGEIYPAWMALSALEINPEAVPRQTGEFHDGPPIKIF